MKAFLIASAVALGLIGLNTSPAEAAKGVKKPKAPAGPKNVSGVVTRVQPLAGKAKVGSVTISTVGSKKKGKPAANGGKAAGQPDTFTLTAATTVVAGHNGPTRAVPLAALAVGEHVTILANSDQATTVTIHTPAIKKKRPAVRRKVR